MMRTFKQRVLVALLVTIVATICGSGMGYWLGRFLTLRQAESRLDQYAMRIREAGEASSSESRSLLATLNASPYPYCSDAEIAYFRDLLLRAEYLRDAGHIRNGKIDCSAMMGRPAQPLVLPQPDFLQMDGIKAYRNITPSKTDHRKQLGVQLGDSFVVFSVYILKHLKSPPMHYTITVRNAPDQPAGRLSDGLAPAPAQILTQEGKFQLKGSLYATRCSTRYFDCITTYNSIPEVLQYDHSQLYIWSALGGLIGAFLSVFCSIVYRRSRSMEQQLRRAIRKDELRVVYQPIVHLASERIVGAEALVRWTDEDGVPVGPDVFVQIAEDNGFVGEITQLVLRHALRDMGETLRSHPDFRLSINVSAADLADPKFLPMLENSLRRTKVLAQSVTIEITESSTARQQIVVETIHQLRKRGHSVHIDDFGTGYSSLAYLKDLSVNAIKIDRAFTQAIGTEAVTLGILPQILAMAKMLNLQVVVEGIETEQQAAYFATSNPSLLAQGWLFGRPIPADEFHRLLAEDEKKPPAPAYADSEAAVSTLACG
jgi:sensor c-di-GMP phosphodiesterase-like protein